MKFQPERSSNLTGFQNLSGLKWKTVKITDLFNRKQGIQRYLSGWDAAWISYYDNAVNLPDISGGERIFKKVFQLDSPVGDAKIAITADQTYELSINGQLAGSGHDWKEAAVYNISGLLRKGENVVEVKTTQTKGLLLQGAIRMKNGKSTSLRSDESWLVSAGQADWRPAFRLADPPLGTWGNIANPLKKIAFPLTVWYKQQLPPGAIALIKPEIQGKYTIYVNGKQVRYENGKESVDISGLLKKNDNVLTVSVVATDETCGLIQPIGVICGKTNTPLVAWNDLGIAWYSGRAIYTKKVSIPSGYLGKDTRLILNPGQVNYFAEIWVNDKLVSFHPWAPFETDLTGYLNAGENKVSIVVANLLANQASWNILDANINSKEARWWHDGSIQREKEKLISGLLGPVCITPYKWESIEINR
jgi:hypothetical protein